MGRLRQDLLERVEAFSHEVLDLVVQLEAKHLSRRIIDQMAASGTSVGANVFEADEAMSRKDFVKCLSIAAKELSEARYWLRLAVSRDWIPIDPGQHALAESAELRKILGTMIVRSRSPAATKTPRD